TDVLCRVSVLLRFPCAWVPDRSVLHLPLDRGNQAIHRVPVMQLTCLLIIDEHIHRPISLAKELGYVLALTDSFICPLPARTIPLTFLVPGGPASISCRHLTGRNL